MAALARGEVSVTPVRLLPMDLPFAAPAREGPAGPGDLTRPGGSPGERR